MARPDAPPGIGHANELGVDHIPTSLPAQPDAPPGIGHANELGVDHIPTSLPAQPDHPALDNLPEELFANGRPEEHPQGHVTELPEDAGHMADTTQEHLPDWLLLA
jgi:hypothetical protein